MPAAVRQPARQFSPVLGGRARRQQDLDAVGRRRQGGEAHAEGAGGGRAVGRHLVPRARRRPVFPDAAERDLGVPGASAAAASALRGMRRRRRRRKRGRARTGEGRSAGLLALLLLRRRAA
ncbi:MAG: hypothetical protein BJ554DRAFT_4269, partial [Olpidium bornovanus]